MKDLERRAQCLPCSNCDCLRFRIVKYPGDKLGLLLRSDSSYPSAVLMFNTHK